MRKILFTIIGLALASPAWSSQTAVTEISGTQPSVGALKTQVNTKLGTVESNRQDHETRVAAMETGKETKAVIQASAPADTTVDWYDTDQETGVLILKRHNGTTWLRTGSHGVQYASSCASITAGMCVDTDDGKLYYHNGTAVVEVGTGGSGTTYTAGTGIDITGGVISSTVTGSVPSGTVNGQVLLWTTDQWAASTPPWLRKDALGTGVEAALGYGVDAAGGLASYSSIREAIFSTGFSVANDTPSPGKDTISIYADTTPTDGSAKPITSNAVFDALAGKQNADADLTTAAGATGAGNSKYFGTNSSGTAGFYDLPSGSGGGGYVLGLGSIFKNAAVSGAVRFCGITSTGESGSSFARSATPIPATGTATVAYAYVSTSDAQPATGSQVCTLYVNDVATGMIITITASGSGIFTSSGTASVSAGDRAAWSCVNNAAASAGTITSIVISVQ